jgi:predicted CXXCH cytochrome family protein
MKFRLKSYKKKISFVFYGALLISALVFGYSCSSQKSYEVLSFFFDDVPLPDSTSVIIDTTNLALEDTINVKSMKSALLEQTHPPAEEGSCNNCHDIGNSFSLIEKQPALCYSCHDDFTKTTTFLHGPLILGNCSFCHDPHKSKFSHFLKLDGQDLCFYCHGKEDVMKNGVHSDIGETKCWDCHNPHGGSDKTFMK